MIKNLKVSMMVEKDLERWLEIQNERFDPALQEKTSVMRRRFELFSEGCWIAEVDNKVVGYLVSHPWEPDSPPMLGKYIESLPESSEGCIYLHDIGVSSAMAGLGVGGSIFKKFKEFAIRKGYTRFISKHWF